MKEISVQAFNHLFDYLHLRTSTVLWIRSTDYQKQLYVSPNFSKIWNQPTDILYEYPESWESFLCQDEREPLIQAVEKRIQSPNEIKQSLLFYRVQGEEMHFIRDEAFCLKDNEDNHVGYLGLAETVTEQAWLSGIQNGLSNELLSTLKTQVFQVLNQELKLKVGTQKQGISILDALSGREKECMHALLQGETAKHTARRLNLSHRTVEFYINSLKEKLNCHNKLALVSKITLLLQSNR